MDHRLILASAPPMTPEQQYCKMLCIVAMLFHGDKDKGGKPYILHLMAVDDQDSTDFEFRTMCLGHDLVEDKGKYVSFTALLNAGFSERVVHGIRCGTKLPGESYEEYKAKVKSNRDTVRWKKRDIRHNMDLRRLKGVTEKDMERMNNYIQFYWELDTLEKSWTT